MAGAAQHLTAYGGPATDVQQELAGPAQVQEFEGARRHCALYGDQSRALCVFFGLTLIVIGVRRGRVLGSAHVALWWSLPPPPSPARRGEGAACLPNRMVVKPIKQTPLPHARPNRHTHTRAHAHHPLGPNPRRVAGFGPSNQGRMSAAATDPTGAITVGCPPFASFFTEGT